MTLEFKNRLKKLRKENNLSLDTLGKELNLSKSVLSYYEHGKRFPQINTLKSISDFFGVSFDYLVGNDTKVLSENDTPKTYMSDGEVAFIKEIRKHNGAYEKMVSDPERAAKLLEKALK